MCTKLKCQVNFLLYFNLTFFHHWTKTLLICLIGAHVICNIVLQLLDCDFPAFQEIVSVICKPVDLSTYKDADVTIRYGPNAAVIRRKHAAEIWKQKQMPNSLSHFHSPPCIWHNANDLFSLFFQLGACSRDQLLHDISGVKPKNANILSCLSQLDSICATDHLDIVSVLAQRNVL